MPSLTTLRVTSGTFRGQVITSPGETGVHPMGSREKLALFNLLQPYLFASSRVLDAYAGSGALGVEVLSRGAKNLTFVEKNPKVARLIEQNLAKLKIPDSSTKVLAASVEKAVKILPDSSFDIIIADPPYNNFSINSIELLTKLLRNGGILALSHPKIEQKVNPIKAQTNKIRESRKTQDKVLSSKNPPAPELPGLKLLKTRTYAAAQLSIYAKRRE